ncbi:MAG TPA: aminotransferase class V-fold PLP-dependent enzyme, partial [Candidatus Babeliaceae bacterium]|nr:aminotransferase class V-fold PLP-dependent enzyme [Candidatus Babeliaceae bacterium]
MITECRSNFPFFRNEKNRKVPIYLDSAATTQKPEVVIQAIADFYRYENAPLHRGIYRHAEQATVMYEHVRKQIAEYIDAVSETEIIFTHGATEGINIVAQAWAKQQLESGDEIILTELEHHANILPWQKLGQERNLVIRWIPIRTDGTLDITVLPNILSSRTKLISCTADSNVLGSINSL